MSAAGPLRTALCAAHQTALWAALLLALPAAPAAADGERCRADAMGEWYCANDPRGSAVVDALGAVVCAPGRCVEFEGDWHCSARPAGAAELTPAGPVCEGECRTPRASDCERI